MVGKLVGLYRYPVKGLSGEALQDAALTPGAGLAHDRRFAIAHGAAAFDRHSPSYLPPTQCLTLKTTERLAQLRGRFDPDTDTLTLERAGRQVARGKLSEPLGRTLVEQFLAAFLSGETRGSPKILEAPGHMFSDHPEKVLSVINLASIRDLERVARAPLDPRRFRGNLLVDCEPAWVEFEWLGAVIAIGDVRLTVRERIDRCAATNVHPETAERDLNLPLALRSGFGHADLGIYCEVKTPGLVTVGDSVRVLS